MDRLRLSFVVLLVTSLSLGGFTVVDFGSRLEDIDAVGSVEQRVSVAVTDVSIRDDSIAITTRLRNPTRRTLQLDGARFRIYNATDRRLASGAGIRLDDGGSTLPARGSLTVTYAVRMSDAQRDRVRATIDRDASVAMNFAMTLGDTSMVVRAHEDITHGGS